MSTQKITLNKLYSIIVNGNKKLEEKIKVENAKTYGLLYSQIKLIAEKITKLPTKGEFYDQMDEVMTELSKIRDEQTSMEGRITKLEDRKKN